MRLIRQSFNASLLFMTCALAVGCASSKTSALVVTSEHETAQEAASALGHVAGVYAGKELSQEELNKLAQDIENDPEAQSAIEAIAGSMEGEKANIKYSPATGKRYSGNLEFDPETGVKLLPLEP